MEIKYRTVFYKIIDKLLNHLTEYFSNTEIMEFFGSPNYEKFDACTLKCNIPHHLYANGQEYVEVSLTVLYSGMNEWCFIVQKT